MKSSWNESILDQIKDMVYVVCSNDYQLVSANQRFKERFPEYHKGIKCHKLIFGSDTPCEICGINEATKDKPAVLNKYIDDGEMIEVSFQKKYKDDLELCLCTASNLPSVTESMEVMRDVLNSINAAAYTINPDTYRITFVNSYLKSLLPEMKRGALCFDALMGRTSPCPVCPFNVMKSNGDTYHMHESYIRKLKKYLNIDAVNVIQPDGQNSVVFTGYDITEQVEREKRLSKIAYLDLTVNLQNQLAFLRDTQKLFESNTPFYIYLLRLKNFRNYNLMLGRKAGDEFIKTLADHYCSLYSDKNKIYRIGGVKFAFIATNELDRQKAHEIASNPICDDIGHRNKLFLPEVNFVGIELPLFAENAQMALHHLEYTLSRQVERETGTITYFKASDIEKMERDNRIISLVKGDVRKNGFQVFYQPVYSIQEKKFTKCEALIRLYDKELGWVSPADFIPIAEANGTIGVLGQFVMEEVCKLLEEFKRNNFPNVQININVSSAQFSTEDFYETVKRTINQYDFDYKLLHMEITESIMIHSFEYIINVMSKIIALGIDFSIDDFGTGYSNISYLGALPLSGLKLDRSFIEHVAHSDVHAMIVRNVVKFSKDLGFHVVAEGVENLEQFNILKRLGCDYIQGFLFSKAIPKEDYISFLQEQYSYNV